MLDPFLDRLSPHLIAVEGAEKVIYNLPYVWRYRRNRRVERQLDKILDAVVVGDVIRQYADQRISPTGEFATA
jgi:hypothetical protein